MQQDPTAEHEWLKQLVGEWEFESEAREGPDTEPVRMSGAESVRMLGDLWVVGEMRGEMSGGGLCVALMTIGFDPARGGRGTERGTGRGEGRGKFVGAWVGSPMTHMFVYEGELDAARKVLTLDTTGPSFTDPSQEARYQDIVELPGDGTRILRSQFRDADGKWHEFMRGLFRRVGCF